MLLLCGRAQSGKTPLNIAAMNGQLEVVRLLLEHGADKDANNNNVRPPRATAATCCVGMCGSAKLAVSAH